MLRHTLFSAIKSAQPVRQYAVNSEQHLQLQKELTQLRDAHIQAKKNLEIAKNDLKNAEAPMGLSAESRISVEVTRDYFAHLSRILPASLGEDCGKIARSAGRLLNKKNPIDLDAIDSCKDRVKYFQEVTASQMSQMCRKLVEIKAVCEDNNLSLVPKK